MNCEKCQDRGFTEENHGLLMVLCDCEVAKKMRVELELPEVTDDSNSGIGQPDTTFGSGDTSEPEQPQKPKVKRKARKRAK